MGGNGDRLKINEPTIVHENIDGETVILNLDSGNYYSVVDAGARIWGISGSISRTGYALIPQIRPRHPRHCNNYPNPDLGSLFRHQCFHAL